MPRLAAIGTSTYSRVLFIRTCPALATFLISPLPFAFSLPTLGFDAGIPFKVGMAGARCPPDEPASSADANVMHYSDDERSIAADSWSVKSEYGSTLDGEDQRNADVVDASNASFRPIDYMCVPRRSFSQSSESLMHMTEKSVCQFAMLEACVGRITEGAAFLVFWGPVEKTHWFILTLPIFIFELYAILLSSGIGVTHYV